MANMLWIDGVLTPMRSAKLRIGFPDPKGLHRARGDVAPRDVTSEDVGYSLALDVDDSSGEDAAAAPEIQSIPVWKALGGSHPSLAQLGLLDLSNVGTAEDWDAWFGNDAPFLTDNRLRFNGWRGFRLRLRWEARSDDGWALLHEDAPAPGTLIFEGEAEFDGLNTNVRQPDDGDEFVKAVWGEAQFAGLRRTEEHWHIMPDGHPHWRPPSVNIRYMPIKPPADRSNSPSP